MLRPNFPGTEKPILPIAFGTAETPTRLGDDEAFRLLDRFAELGGSVIDTAHCYSFWVPGGHGASEKQIGRYLLKSGRRDLLIATKGGHVGMGGYPRPDEFMTPELLRKDFDQSTERLGLAVFDLYYYHRDDPRVPVAELIDAMDDLVQDGKVRAVGVSNWTADRVLEANDYARQAGRTPISVHQNQWSYCRPQWTEDGPGAVRTLVPNEAARIGGDGVMLMPYSATGNGYFSGDSPRPGQFESPQNAARFALVKEVANKHGITGTQVALAWLMGQGYPVVPIVGTCTLAHLEEAVAAADIDLSADDLAALAEA